MHRLSLFQIGLTLNCLLNTKTSGDNVKLVLKKAEDAIVLTHETLLKQTNIHGLFLAMWGFNNFNYGSRDLWNKLANLLEIELKKKREPLDST